MKPVLFILPVLFVFTFCKQQNDQSTDLWEIPGCAWEQELGIRPVFESEHFQSRHSTPETITKKGIPLGGIGAGNFMYNLCGSFGPFCFTPGDYRIVFSKQAAFHVFEEAENSGQTTTLATEDVLPAWKRIEPGNGKYYALFPRGWVQYDEFVADISMQFFSPVIRDNYKETSYPAGVFLFRLKNPTEKPVKVSVMFTFPNLTAPAFPDSLGNVRQGLYNKKVTSGSMTGILMGADDPDNRPIARHTEWCIATQNPSGVVETWDGNGNGSDVWDDFSKDGILNQDAYTQSTSLPSGALSVTKALQPGEEQVVPFVLTWHFPQTRFKSGTRWLKKYTEYYPEAEGTSFEMAKDALANYREWLKAVIAWTDPIVKNPAYPGWLKQGALNELYYSTFGHSFWENGCLTKQKQFGNRPGQHLSFVLECNAYTHCETFDVRHHPAITNRRLWPEMERDILLAYADFIMDTPDGSCPHDAGGPGTDPYFDYDHYFGVYKDRKWSHLPGRRTTPWSEFSPKFIQQCYAYYDLTKDADFLEEIWGAAVRTFHYHMTTDTNNDGITEMTSSEYEGNKLLNATLWIGALEAMKKICKLLDDTETLPEVEKQLGMARTNSEKQFWNDRLGYYQYNQSKDYIMADAMIGQLYNDITGLPPVLNAERMTSHYKQAFKRLVLPLEDNDHDGIGDIGAANVLTSEGKPALKAPASKWFPHAEEVWTGISYSLSANLYHWGKRINDGALQSEALHTAWGVYRTTWLSDDHPYWFTTPEAWRIDDPAHFRALMYQRPRAIWSLLFAMDDPYQKQE